MVGGFWGEFRVALKRGNKAVGMNVSVMENRYNYFR